MLYLSGDEGCCFYLIEDLDDPGEWEFLYRIGRIVLDCDIDIVPLIAPRKCFREASISKTLTDDRDAVIAFVEKYKERCFNQNIKEENYEPKSNGT